MAVVPSAQRSALCVVIPMAPCKRRATAAPVVYSLRPEPPALHHPVSLTLTRSGSSHPTPCSTFHFLQRSAPHLDQLASQVFPPSLCLCSACPPAFGFPGNPLPHDWPDVSWTLGLMGLHGLSQTSTSIYWVLVYFPIH